jgi:L-fuconolactonase
VHFWGLLFGSDWPVCTLAASFDEVVRACEDSLGGLGRSARDLIFGANAISFYQLGG